MAQKLETRCKKTFILFQIQSKKPLFFPKIAFKKLLFSKKPARGPDRVFALYKCLLVNSQNQTFIRKMTEISTRHK